MWRRIHLTALAALAASSLFVSKASAQAPSIWTDVMSKKKLTSCIVPSYQPYSWKDQDGKWQGFVAEMARNVAGATARRSRVRRDLFQDGRPRSAERKMRRFFRLQRHARARARRSISPARSTRSASSSSTAMAGQPPGPGWADYNKPEIRICYPLGTSMEQQAKRWDSKATLIGARLDR